MVPEPIKPTRCCYAEEGARARESEYVPGLIDRIIGRGAKKRKLLCDDVLTAIDADENEYTRSLSEWELAHKDWSDSITWANRVLSRDAQAKIDVIRELNPFSDISDLGSQLTFTVGKTAILEATLHVRGTAAIPKESKSLLSNSKLSVKKIPVSEFHEIYQDYVCSCVLRVSREVFAILPDDIVIVTASDDLLNTATGHKEELPILSVAVSRETIKILIWHQLIHQIV
ncbi:MAG: hypothetical protein ACXW1F_08305 [Halobacteriota archaeon]